MRTTLNLDDDVAAQLTVLARRRARSLSRTANDLMRVGLSAEQEPPPTKPYDPPVLDTGRPFVDVTDVAATLELLDTRR